MLEKIILELAALLGFSVFVSLLVNVLKIFGVVKDGTADKWVAGFNLVGVLALYTVRIINPTFDPSGIDKILLEIGTVGAYILGYITTLLGSKLTYVAVRNLPIIGKSNTDDRALPSVGP